VPFRVTLPPHKERLAKPLIGPRSFFFENWLVEKNRAGPSDVCRRGVPARNNNDVLPLLPPSLEALNITTKKLLNYDVL